MPNVNIYFSRSKCMKDKFYGLKPDMLSSFAIIINRSIIDVCIITCHFKLDDVGVEELQENLKLIDRSQSDVLI